MLDSRVALESFNAVVFFTLSARLFDDAVMNSSYCSCEFLSNFSNVAQSSSPVNCRLLFGHRDDCLLCANCPTFSAFRCFRSFLRLRLSTHVPRLDFLASTALLLTSSRSALSLLVCLLLALLFCQLKTRSVQHWFALCIRCFDHPSRPESSSSSSCYFRAASCATSLFGVFLQRPVVVVNSDVTYRWSLQRYCVASTLLRRSRWSSARAVVYYNLFC